MFSDKGVFVVFFPPNIDKKQIKPRTSGGKWKILNMTNSYMKRDLFITQYTTQNTHTHINTSSHKFSWLNNSSWVIACVVPAPAPCVHRERRYQCNSICFITAGPQRAVRRTCHTLWPQVRSHNRGTERRQWCMMVCAAAAAVAAAVVVRHTLFFPLWSGSYVFIFCALCCVSITGMQGGLGDYVT